MMEPFATIASVGRRHANGVDVEPDDRIGAREDLAKTLGRPAPNVRVDSPFVGGGFGGKLFLRADAVLAALGAKATGRPVKVAMTRPMMFNNSTHRPATIQSASVSGPNGRAS